MPEFIHTFQRGRMNKDLDERLIPNGEYRDALNLDIANSDGSNVGTLQNVKGNVEIRYREGVQGGWQANYIDDLTNPVCIGSIRDDKNEKIYWFIASDDTSAIAEYDQTTGFIYPILVDKNNILNFSPNYLITGINIVDKFLFWTDDQTEPKKINIEKFKTGSKHFNAHTKIPKWLPQTNTYQTNILGQPDFTEEDVTVIKKSPLNAPTLFKGASSFDVPGQPVQPGTGINPVITAWNYLDLENFTYKPNIIINPNAFDSLPTYAEYLELIAADPDHFQNSSLNESNSGPYPNSDPTYYWDGRITFVVNEVPSATWVPGALLIFSGELKSTFGPSNFYKISVKIYSISGLTVTAEIQAISIDIGKRYDENGDSVPIEWEVLLQEKKPLFEYIFPRFAYRWKYIDGEYSCFSPFSEPAFIGNDFEYISSDGYNIGMTNNIRKLIVSSLDWSNQEISEIDILYKESNNNSVYIVDTLKKSEYQNTTLPTDYEIKTELIGAAVEPNQILRPWDNVPRMAKAQEIVANRVIYGNYLQNYNTTGVINTSTGDISTPVKIRTSLFAQPYPDDLVDNDGTPISKTLPYKSLKSIRTYQVGLVYKDKYGRETPVFTSDDAGLQVEITNSTSRNSIEAQPQNTPPEWATHYKFFIKETSNEYYNLALDRYYLAEDGNVWLSFPSSERNKVDEETYLILKKQHDNNTAVTELNRYKILAIESSAPDFISTFDAFVTSRGVTSENEIEQGRITIEFGTTADPGEFFRQAISSSGNSLTITYQGTTSDKYDISGATISDNNQSFDVTLEKPLGAEVQAIPNGATNITISIYKEEVKRLPEFEGRFFVKINRDFAFDTNIIDSFEAQNKNYAVSDELDFIGVKGEFRGPKGWYYSDYGENSGDGFGCNGERTKWTIMGWPGNGTPVYGNGVQWEQSEGAMPPYNGNNVFSIIHLGTDANAFIDNMGGYTDDRYEITAPNGTLNVGVKIRFSNNDPNASPSQKLSKVYTIIEAKSRLTPRGAKRIVNVTDCINSNEDWNWKNTYIYKLDNIIDEPWMPNFVGDWTTLQTTLPSIQIVEPVFTEGNKILSSSNPAIFETEPKESVDLDLYYEASNAFPIAEYNTAKILDWFNCYTYGQGVESNRIRDDYNAPYIDKGPKISTVLDAPYAEERRGSGMIFSQIFNSLSGINRLNQFIQAEAITKDLNPIYGTIQKLHSRDTDAIVLCEDKCLKILANKDALYNADGNVNLTGNNAVLGQAIPYAGEFGISKNPESFSSYAFRAYFSDKNRGAVIRLSMDGITNISDKGMSDFFADNLRVSRNIIGSYDDDKDIYNITLDRLTSDWNDQFNPSQDYQLNPDCNARGPQINVPTTISFKESVDGWTSRKSFIPESGVSLNNRYYTFKEGRVYEHGINIVANNFYGIQYDSSFNVIVNEMPNNVKGFSTVNYTGTQSRRFEYLVGAKWYSIAEINFNTTIPTAVRQKQPGWYVNYIKTDLEGGEVKEFEKKEGKWFNYIKALEIFNDCEITGDGIGNPDEVDSDPQEYILTVTIDEECSGSGSNVTPDTIQFFVNIWDNIKTDPILDLNIINQPTALDAKCAIEAHYDLLNQSYGGVINDGAAFSYIFNEGLQIGTQMYNSLTNEPISSAGTYLYVGPGENISEVTVNHAGLDANNATAVPPTYYVMILNSSGQIASWTQYNTLDPCQGDPDMSRRGVQSVQSNYLVAGVPTANPYNFNFMVPFNTSTNQSTVCNLIEYLTFWFNLDPEDRGAYGGGTRDFFWYGPNDFEVGTQLYVFDNIAQEYVPFQPAFNSRALFRGTGDLSAPAVHNGQLMVPPTAPDEWYWVEISTLGVITSIDLYNTYSVTLCSP